MPDRLPASVPTLIIGAGVHGLSTAWHLARAGQPALVVDKAEVAAGASGIACGIVRNNYFQPAMQELMAACVEVWESEAERLHYHPSGYIALGPASQESDLTEVWERHQRIGYPSQLFLGEDEVTAHMTELYDDWRAPGLSVCLHESAGGYGFNKESIQGLAALAQDAGAEIMTGIEVTGFRVRPVGLGDRRADQRRHGRRRAGGRRRRAVDRLAVVDARTAGSSRRPPARRPRRRRPADVDLLVPAGGRVRL